MFQTGCAYWTIVGMLLTCSAIAVAGNPGYHRNGNCDMVVTGGSFYRLLDTGDDGLSIRVHEFRTGKRALVTREDRGFQNVQLAWSCKRIAYDKFDPIQGAMAVHIVSLSGETERILPSAYRSCWGMGPAGEDILGYIVGEGQEGFPGFTSRGMWIFDSESGESRQVHPEGYELAWSEFDKSFYLWNVRDQEEIGTKVQRIDVASSDVYDTPYQGIDFSLKGTYYFTRAYDGDDFKIYLRETNTELTEGLEEQLRPIYHGDPVGWLSDTEFLLGSYRPMDVTCKIVDVERRQTWDVKQDVIGYVGSAEKNLLVLIDGEVTTRPFSEIATLVYPAKNGRE